MQHVLWVGVTLSCPRQLCHYSDICFILSHTACWSLRFVYHIWHTIHTTEQHNKTGQSYFITVLAYASSCLHSANASPIQKHRIPLNLTVLGNYYQRFYKRTFLNVELLYLYQDWAPYCAWSNHPHVKISRWAKTTMHYLFQNYEKQYFTQMFPDINEI